VFDRCYWQRWVELLNDEIFDSLDDARRKLAFWRYDYNTPALVPGPLYTAASALSLRIPFYLLQVSRTVVIGITRRALGKLRAADLLP
jgi:hypothetical protein|tara:strand:- start:512 stop:775 length:264 start_codon:yes stop_codon:yes gene_type:complete